MFGQTTKFLSQTLTKYVKNTRIHEKTHNAKHNTIRPLLLLYTDKKRQKRVKKQSNPIESARCTCMIAFHEHCTYANIVCPSFLTHFVYHEPHKLIPTEP